MKRSENSGYYTKHCFRFASDNHGPRSRLLASARNCCVSTSRKRSEDSCQDVAQSTVLFSLNNPYSAIACLEKKIVDQKAKLRQHPGNVPRIHARMLPKAPFYNYSRIIVFHDHNCLPRMSRKHRYTDRKRDCSNGKLFKNLLQRELHHGRISQPRYYNS